MIIVMHQAGLERRIQSINSSAEIQFWECIYILYIKLHLVHLMFILPFFFKGILSQSQDKALRRIGELREVISFIE